MIFLEMLKNPAKLARKKLRDAEKQLVSKVFKKILKDETTEKRIDGKVSYLILKNHYTEKQNSFSTFSKTFNIYAMLYIDYRGLRCKPL